MPTFPITATTRIPQQLILNMLTLLPAYCKHDPPSVWFPVFSLHSVPALHDRSHSVFLAVSVFLSSLFNSPILHSRGESEHAGVLPQRSGEWVSLLLVIH